MKMATMSMLLYYMGSFSAHSETLQSIYDFSVEDIDGKEVSLEHYRGKVVMIVNVASKCGYTPQYEVLQALHQRYEDRGFVVLGFPANNFLGQEPGTNEEIKTFCTLNYGVTFPMFSKISVKGKTMHPLYGYLTSKKTNPKYGGPVTWNFNKFLVDREGNIVARFGTGQDPQSPIVISTLERVLG